MLKIPYYKPSVPKNWSKIIDESLKSGWLTTGPIVNEFESKLSLEIGVKNVVALNSCTGALHLALAAKGFNHGDKFIVPTYTFVASVGCGEYLGMEPVLIDNVEDNFQIDLNKIEENLKKDSKIKAIIPVHIGGDIVNLDELIDIAARYDIFVLEDAAHLIGNPENKTYERYPNHAQAYSFYANKNITTLGEGGALATFNDELASKVRRLSLHGITRDGWDRYAGGKWEYDVTNLGFKYNMPDIAASFGLWQLSQLRKMQRRRREIAEKYISGLKSIDGVITPLIEFEKNALHLFTIRFEIEKWKLTRDQIIIKLIEMGISVSVHYKPIHLFTYYKINYGYSVGDFPRAEKLYSSIVSLPFYPLLKDNEINYIVDSIKNLSMKYLK